MTAASREDTVAQIIMDAVQHRIDFNTLTVRHIIEPSSNTVTLFRELRNIAALIATAYVLSTAIGTFRDRSKAHTPTTSNTTS